MTGTGNQDWNVLGGTLTLAGTINGNVSVAAGGTFGGVGTVGSSISVNGGTLAPGSPTGTLNVSGDLSFTSASHYMVQVSGTSNGVAVVTGTATLAGATVVVVPTGSIAKHYTILNAGTLPDSFNPVVAGLSSNLHATLSYDPNNVFLDLALGYGGGLNINQQNVANILTHYFDNTGSLPVVLANLSPTGLTQASGESGTGSQQTTFNAMNQFIGLLTDVFSAGRGGAPGATPYADETNATAYAATRKNANEALASIYRKAPPLTFEQRWDVWAAGYGGSQATDGNAALGSNNATSSVYGTAVGLDYRFSPSTIVRFCARRRRHRLQCHRARLGPLGFVPGRRLRASQRRTGLCHGRAGLWLAGRHDQSHRHRRRRGSIACAVQRQRALGPCRGRLSLCLAVDRPHPLCGAPGHRVQPSELFGVRCGRQQRLRAELCRQGRDQHPHRTRPARGQVLCRSRRPDNLARPRRLGA
ncbi:hypothetical protein ACVWZV_001327 [Bradyrhizobium sp. GM5.1]